MTSSFFSPARTTIRMMLRTALTERARRRHRAVRIPTVSATPHHLRAGGTRPSASHTVWEIRHDAPPTPPSTANRDLVVTSAPVRHVRPLLDVTVDRTDRRLILTGQFDMAALNRFAAAAASLFVGRRGDISVDLAGVTFVDAAGLGALVKLQNMLRRGGHRLRVIGPNAMTARVFRLGGLAELLDDAD